MAAILIVYGTSEGQTAKVAERLAGTLAERGHDATVVDTGSRADADPAEFDGTLVGSSIHVGKQQAGVTGFVTANRDSLAEQPTGLFQLSLSSAADEPERRAAAAGYVDSFVEATGWQPDRVGLFGGALRYSEYGFLKRLVMKRIAREATGDTDTARDYDYTDWGEVEAFANDFAAFVEGRLGERPGGADD